MNIFSYWHLIPFALAFCLMASNADELRMNHIQVIGTHNSYHERAKDDVFAQLKEARPDVAASLDYSHAPLDVQLDRGARSFEIDAYYDPAGFKVFHVPVIDAESTCPTFVDCMGALRDWSLAHPGHVPITVLIQTKDEQIPQIPTAVLKVDGTALNQLDQEIFSVFQRDHLLAPDDVRGDYQTLREAIVKRGWPTLEQSRGKIVLALHEGFEKIGLYADGGTSMQGRPMFPAPAAGFSPDNLMRDDASIIVMNDPFDERIAEVVKQGFFVRTRADSGVKEARENDVTRREAAFASGAHVISTDFPEGTAHRDTGYIVRLPNAKAARCNPVFAPEGCTDAELEDPEILRLSKQTRDRVKSVKLPEMAPADLTPYSSLGALASIEPSGLVKSRLWDGVFWSHNDSGDEPRIFAVNKNGDVIENLRYGNFAGCRIPDAVNVDWEDMASDDNGHLILGDFGNRPINNRRDFCLYFIIEPHPLMGQTSVFKKIFFMYPDLEEIPPEEKNYDCESLFWANGKPYLLTKNRSDTYTKLYRMDVMDPREVNYLTFLDTFNIQGQATAADATEDGTKLAVLCYNAIWLFEVEEGSDDYFDGKISWLPIQIGGCEAIAFDGDALIISSEEEKGDLYEVPLSRLVVVKE